MAIAQTVIALEHLAALLRRRNEIDAEIGAAIGRPPTSGHLGEYVAAVVFGIKLERSAAAKGIDGRFSRGPLDGRTVQIKYYTKHEGLLDLTVGDTLAGFHLVLTGPRGQAASSRGTLRPWLIETVYLFATSDLLDALRARGVKIGIATSVVSHLWEDAQIYPRGENRWWRLSDEERKALDLFRAPA